MDKAQEILDRFDDSETSATLKQNLTETLNEACDYWSINHYCLKANLRLADGEVRKLKLTNYPSVWLDRYMEADYVLIDPAARHAIDHVEIASLEQLMDDVSHSALKKRFMDDARDLGVGGGITLPLRSPYLSGFINFNYKNSNNYNIFQTFALKFSSKLSENLGQFCHNADASGGYHTLSLREKQVIFWASNGKTAWETAMILGISQRTVVAHLVNSMSKLQCKNKYQMLSRISSFIMSDFVLDQYRIEF